MLLSFASGVLHISYICLPAQFLCLHFALTYLFQCQAHHGLSSDKPNTVSSSPAQEQQKQEATDDLVIGTQSGYDNVHATASSNACVVHEPELSETPVLN